MPWERPPTPPLRPRHRRYEWCWLRNDFRGQPLWTAVAQATGLHVNHVRCVVLRLECLANKSIPRGSVADMSIVEFAAALALDAADVARVRTCLEDPAIA
jgi:hypothetical protein